MLRVKMASRAAPVLFSQGGLAPRKIVNRSARTVPLYEEAICEMQWRLNCSERCGSSKGHSDHTSNLHVTVVGKARLPAGTCKT